MAYQPRVCLWLAEAGQPVSVPGMARQQLHRPNNNDCNNSTTDHVQDVTEAQPAEDLGEDSLEDSHPGTQESKGPGCPCTCPLLTVAVLTVSGCH